MTLQRHYKELPRTIKECHALIRELDETIDDFRARVEQLERELYGVRRERFLNGEPDEAQATDHNEQAQPNNADDAKDDTAIAPAGHDDTSDAVSATPDGDAPDVPQDSPPPISPPTPPRKRPASKGRRKRVYPPDTPRLKVYHPLDPNLIPPEVLHDPRARRFYRFEREEVELPQPGIRILEHFREIIVVDNPATEQSTMLAAPMPEPVLPACYASDSLLAYVAVSRFADHLPYYREEDIIRRSGLSIVRSTQWRWMRGLAGLLTPLVAHIRKHILQGRIVGIDETPCPMLDPELPYTRTTYLYAQVGDETQPYVTYYFAEHKTRANIEKMLKGFEGVLQSDAYICYELITGASLNRLQPAGCWAHGRRKFEPLVAGGKKHPRAQWILAEIQKLYDIEDRARTYSADERLVLREAESRPIVNTIHAWMEQQQKTSRPRDTILQGVNYFLKRWSAFTRFLEDGAIPIDNNRTEAAIKAPVMGKRAWLFFGNSNAGETAAILYTIVMSCKRHNVDPYAYLVDVMRRVKTAEPGDLDALLPDQWLKSHPEAYVEQRAKESQAAAHRKRARRARRRLTPTV